MSRLQFGKRRTRTLSVLLAIVAATLTLAAGCTLSPPSAQAQSEDDAAPRTIQVRGTGSVSAQPNVATLRLGVQTEAESADTALTQNSEQMQSVIAALEDAGISSDNIQTQSIQLRPRYEEEPRQATRELVGYAASNIVEVHVEDLEALGATLDAAVQAGGNRVEGIQFEISDPATLQDQAREAAWEDARHKAEQLASLANAELGAALHVNESSSQPRPVVEEEIAMAREARVPIEPGTQTLEVDIRVEWELQ